MANPEHLKILKQGVEAWNKWREENPEVEPDLSGADLSKAELSGVEFSKTILCKADFSEANLYEATLYEANLSEADFSKANLARANLSESNLSWARFYRAYLFKTNFSKANLAYVLLSYANPMMADFSEAHLLHADMSGCQLIKVNLTKAVMLKVRVYGVSAWDIKKDGLIQKDLIITPLSEPEITVDDLEVAQFIYLMLNNDKLRNLIETITSKAVLILGRFTPDRKAVLDAIKDELRLRNCLPIVFDFENAENKSVDETVNLLARMSRFVIADITDAKSIPQELRGIVPDNPSIPIIPLIWAVQREYGMFEFFKNYPWVLPLHEYESPEVLLKNIIPAIIEPAENKVLELRRK